MLSNDLLYKVAIHVRVQYVALEASSSYNRLAETTTCTCTTIVAFKEVYSTVHGVRLCKIK